MRQFHIPRIIPFDPSFKWVDTVEEAADIINQPHEDYPARVGRTIEAINSVTEEYSNAELLRLHAIMFNDEVFAGEFRYVRVVVGWPRQPCPDPWDVHKYFMPKLQLYHGEPLTIARLEEWYTDFEEIHPFQDGNGRVGGTIIAGHSFRLFGKYYTPCQ